MSNPKILFLSFAVPDLMMDEIIRQERNQPQIAAHKLQWNIINGIEANLGTAIDRISSVAVSDFPTFPKIFFGYRSFFHRDGAKYILMPFMNIILFKHLTRFISALFFLSRWLWHNKEVKNRQVIVYGMNSSLMLATIMATHLFGGTRILIVPDLPAYADYGTQRGPMRRLTKPLDIALLMKLLKKIHGLIVLTPYIAEDFAPGVPAITVEGIISSTAGEQSIEDIVEIENADTKIIAYAGNLKKGYGIELLIEAFSLIADKNYCLWFFGKGMLEEEVEQACLRDHRITYWGFKEPNELKGKLQQATLLAHPRLSHNTFVRYSFPSKILEYMKIGRPVISSILPGIPAEYYHYIYPLEDETSFGLAKRICEIVTKPTHELTEFGFRAKEFVEKEKNYIRQGARICEFLKTL